MFLSEIFRINILFQLNLIFFMFDQFTSYLEREVECLHQRGLDREKV